MNDILLKMDGISKTFPGVKALDNVHIEIRKGEVHALLGENGAGKSTLLKILSGAYTKDAGRIEFDGKVIDYMDTKIAEDLGITAEIAMRGIRRREFGRFIEKLENLPEMVTYFDEALWGSLVNHVKVYAKDNIVFILTSGMEIKA